MSSFFVEISLVLALVFLVSLIMNKIKQPLLIGYIITGIIIGPLFLGILNETQNYETLSHIGVALLLFIVGLHLNLNLIKEVGMISLVTGLGQVFFTSFFGFLIAYAFGFSVHASIFIAIALTFSSTIIIVKLLTDKNDLDKLYGKISMGFLIVQDFVAVFILMIIASLMNLSGNSNMVLEVSKTLGIAFIAIIITYLLSKYVMEKLLRPIARSSEMFFIFIIAWCLSIASLFYYLGFSLEIGALLAGVALASSNYKFEISSRIKPLRDFFIVIFFLLLGAQMFPVVGDGLALSERLSEVFIQVQPLIIPAIILSLFVLIGNPLIVLILMSIFKYPTKTGFLAGLTVAQISEFSLILIVMAQVAGFVSSPEVIMVTFIGILTILISTYMILYGEKLYGLLKRFLKIFEPRNAKKTYESLVDKKYEVLMLGFDRMGVSMLDSIKKMHKNYLILDYNPEIIDKVKLKGYNIEYGDVSDYELLSEVSKSKLKLVVSTIPDLETNNIILSHFKKFHDLTIVLTATDIKSAIKLYDNGADYVIVPHLLGGHYISTLIEHFNGDYKQFLKEKIKHLNELKSRN